VLSVADPLWAGPYFLFRVLMAVAVVEHENERQVCTVCLSMTLFVLLLTVVIYCGPTLLFKSQSGDTRPTPTPSLLFCEFYSYYCSSSFSTFCFGTYPLVS